MLPLLLVLWTSHRCWGLVPFTCTNQPSLRSRTCCPVWEDGSPCGMASGRGTCAELLPPPGARPSEDFREWWPQYFFSRLCRCEPKFRGVDCGDCRAGLGGRLCERPAPIAVRRDCSDLPKHERRRLVAALQLAKTTVSDRWSIYGSGSGGKLGFRKSTLYDALVWAHYVTGKPPPGDDPNRPRYGHQSIAFLPWHRLQLLWFEDQLRNISGQADLALCVWRWPGKADCDICTLDFFGGSDEGYLTGNFANWTVPCDGSGSLTPSMNIICPAGSSKRIQRISHNPDIQLPTYNDRSQCLKIEEFDTFPFDTRSQNSFRNTLEGFETTTGIGVGMHNRVHQFLSGTMNNVYQAPSDPIFFPVHVASDEIWQTWMDNKNQNGHKARYPQHRAIPEGHRGMDNVMPFLPACRNDELLKSTDQFGYTYEKPRDSGH